MPSFEFEMSFNVLMEKASIVYDCTRNPKFRVHLAEGDVFTPETEKADAYSIEIAHFAKKLKREKTEDVINLEEARDAIRISEAIRESAVKGKKVVLA